MTMTTPLPTTRRRILRRRYGLEPDEFETLMTAQGRACALCRRRFSNRRPAQVDHDHVNGGVRGLLCPRCNYELLGRFGDDVELFERAVCYLLSAPADGLRCGDGVRVPDAPPMW